MFDIIGYVKIAAAAGISFSECRHMTPAEILIYAEAYADRQRQTAYLQALTIRAIVISGLNGKRAPSYEDLFGASTHINDGPMGDYAMFSIAQALNMAMGGDDHLTDKGVS